MLVCVRKYVQETGRMDAGVRSNRSYIRPKAAHSSETDKESVQGYTHTYTYIHVHLAQLSNYILAWTWTNMNANHSAFVTILNKSILYIYLYVYDSYYYLLNKYLLYVCMNYRKYLLGFYQ